MSVLAFIILGFAIFRLFIALFNLLTGNWLKDTTDRPGSFVSVLIPARNEEKNLPALLDSLSRQHHTAMEVIIYDDESEDTTPQIIREFCAKDERFKSIAGSALPAGWVGKNHACHRLGRAAGGDYLLFLDADVVTGPDLIRQSLGFLRAQKLSMLSVFPVQRMLTAGERMTVPVMNWILLNLLPMLLIRDSSWKVFSAANGQFMLFDGEVYRQHWFHEKLKSEKVEDIAICRLMKSQHYRVHTLLGNEQISCRMYEGFLNALHGFSKNVVNFFGNNYLIAILFLLITSLGWVVFVAEDRFDLLLYYVATVVLTRVFVSIASRQNILANIFYLPLQQLSFVFMVVLSARNSLFGKYKWKGRNI